MTLQDYYFAQMNRFLMTQRLAVKPLSKRAKYFLFSHLNPVDFMK